MSISDRVSEARFREAVREIESYGIMPDRPPGLEVVREGLQKIGFASSPFAALLERDPQRSVLVAGTNGKGSVCAGLEALFRARGERVGLYTSPHLIKTSERIRYDGCDIGDSDFVKLFERVRTLLGSRRVSHFEMLTLMAVEYFCSGHFVEPVDRLILEVGLGGLWDATNAVPHGVGVITSLGLDHQNLLGHRLVDIAKNKFGIISPRANDSSMGMPVFHAPFDRELEDLVGETQKATGCRFIERRGFDFRAEPRAADPGFFMKWRGQEFELPLPGLRGTENFALALSIFEALTSTEASSTLIDQALSRLHWPGRMEKIPYRSSAHGEALRIYLSGDHNLQGVKSLVELLRFYPRRELHLIVGTSVDKDFAEMLGELDRALGSNFKLSLTESLFKPRSVEDFGEWSKRAYRKNPDPLALIRSLEPELGPQDMVVVTGSLYLVGRLREALLL